MTTDQKNCRINQTTLHNLLFDVRRSVRYHNRRRLFFDRFSMWSDALTAIFGSATIITLVAKMSLAPSILAAITAILSAINLVFDTKGNARRHHDLARRFIDIEKVLVTPDINAVKFSEAKLNRLDIEAEEPPALRVLDLICHNELSKSMGCDEKEFYRIRFWRAMFANLVDILPSSIKKNGDIQSQP